MPTLKTWLDIKKSRYVISFEKLEALATLDLGSCIMTIGQGSLQSKQKSLPTWSFQCSGSRGNSYLIKLVMMPLETGGQAMWGYGNLKDIGSYKE